MIGLVTHGLILISDGIFVDGWHIHQNMIEGRVDVLHGFFQQQGLPLAVYFHQLLYQLPNPIFFYRLISFLSLIFSAIFIYKICLALPWFSQRDSIIVSIIGLTFPAFQQTVEHTAQGYLACLCLWLGMAWATLNIEIESKIFTRKIIYFGWRIVILSGFIISFHTPSLLTIHIGFAIILIFSAYTRNKSKLILVENVKNAIICNLDYVFLPLVYWVASKIWFPSYGFYTDYNRPEISHLLNSQLWFSFFKNSVFAQLDWAIRDLPGWPLLLFLIIAPSKLYLDSGIKSNINTNSSKVIGILGSSILFLLLGALPYVAVNKIPQPHGESTRFALLVGIPMGLLICSISNIFWKSKNKVVKQLIHRILVALVLCLMWGNISNYLAYQSQWAIVQSLRLHLTQNPEWKQFSNFDIKNYFEPKPNERHSFYLRSHMPWEWAGIFQSVYGNDISRVAIGKEYDPYKDRDLIISKVDGIYVMQYFLIDKLSDSKCIVDMVFTRTPFSANLSANSIALRYWLYKFSSPQQFINFLDNLTEVHVSASGKDCKV